MLFDLDACVEVNDTKAPHARARHSQRRVCTTQDHSRERMRGQSQCSPLVAQRPQAAKLFNFPSACAVVSSSAFARGCTVYPFSISFWLFLSSLLCGVSHRPIESSHSSCTCALSGRDTTPSPHLRARIGKQRKRNTRITPQTPYPFVRLFG